MIDLNMGCPVRKVCKTGAGAALLDDPDKAVAIASAAGEGSGLPVTVKLRPGQRPGDRARRRAGAPAGGRGRRGRPSPSTPATPRSSTRASPTTRWPRELVEALDVPVIVSGGLLSDEQAAEALERSGAEAVMLARGSLGNPWRFERLLGLREGEPTPAEVRGRAALGDRPLPRSTSAPSARAATCASSTPGTPSGWTCPSRSGHELVDARPPPPPRAALSSCGSSRVAESPRCSRLTDPADADRLLHCRVPPGSSIGGFSMPRETLLTPEGLEELKAKIEHLSGARRREVADAHQGGARVRRHLRELRVRRRQERAGHAREADRRPRGQAAQRPGDRRAKDVDTDVGHASASPST